VVRSAAVLLLLGACSTSPPVPPDPFDESLIDALGDPDIDRRDEAMRTIARCGERALPALVVATRSPDPEVAERATALIERIDWNREVPLAVVGSGGELRVRDRTLVSGMRTRPVWEAGGRSLIAWGRTLCRIDADSGAGCRIVNLSCEPGARVELAPDGGLLLVESRNILGIDEVECDQASVLCVDSGSGRIVEDRPLAQSPCWGPAGERYAYIASRQLFIARVGVREVERLTFDVRAKDSPRWSPDGTRIALEWGRDIGILDLRTRAAEAVTNAQALDRDPEWSPDGNWIAFVRWTGDPTQELVVLDVEARRERVLFSANGELRGPRWSPDGKRIAFEWLSSGVWIVEADGTRPRLFAAGASCPAWAPLK
jgi:dipeptidyl aminopeptidase/acylaminoacyl peptidase